MKIKKIVPCMDIKGGKIVKGVNFEGIREIADPIEMAEFYNKSGADELIFYDIAASVEGKGIFVELIKEVKSKVTIPLVVGGGISTLSDVDLAIECGASKVSINTGAINNPEILKEAADKYGGEKVMLSMDIKRVDGKFMIFRGAGRENTGIDAIEWAKKCVALGAGELVVNSIDTDGVKGGFDLEMLKAISDVVSVPIVASGGAGKKEHFAELFKEIPEIETGLAASVFHLKEVDIKELKIYLKGQGICVNI